MMERVPEMGRWLGSEKCREWGEGTGAGDGNVSLERVSVHAVDGGVGAAHGGGCGKRTRPCGDARPGIEDDLCTGGQRLRVRAESAGESFRLRGRGRLPLYMIRP